MTAATHSRLSAEGMAVHGGPRELISNFSMQFSAGEFVAILGRNGSGKTLSLHTLAGLKLPAAGEVRLGGTLLTQIKRREVALRIGLLTQDMEDAFTMTTLESVLIGRHPHLSLWQWESVDDETLAREALESVGLAHTVTRHLDTLSGGEQRRVAMAALLAQQPEIFLLDEPTNHLDPQHQLQLLGLFRGLADKGRTVIATLHDPTLAARYAHRVILLFGDGRWLAGTTSEVLTAEALTELYLTTVVETTVAGQRVFVSV